MAPTGRPAVRPVAHVYRRLLDREVRVIPPPVHAFRVMKTSGKAGVVRRGFTLTEMIIVLLLLALLSGVGGSLFVAGLQAWDSGRTRIGVREDVSYAMDEIVRDLKAMANGSLTRYNSVAQTIQFGERGGDTYVFYLYNAEDSSFDSNYTESLYNLYKADITRGDNPGSGEGTLILRDVVSPDAASPATALEINGTEATLDLIVRRNNETVRTRTAVRPRNL